MAVTVDELHAELQYANYEAQLRRFKSYWKTLSGLAQQARRNPALLPRYRQSLEQGIARLKVLDGERLSDDQAIAAVQDVLDEYERRRAPLAETMAQRQRSLEDWVGRWHPTVWQAFVEAMALMLSDPTTVQVTRLRVSMDGVFLAFMDPSHPIEDAAVRKAVLS